MAEEILRRLRKVFNNMEMAKLEHIAVGQRSRPADGLPGLGYISNKRRIYLMVAHSGMTLAPLLGRLVQKKSFVTCVQRFWTNFLRNGYLGKRQKIFLLFQHYISRQRNNFHRFRDGNAVPEGEGAHRAVNLK